MFELRVWLPSFGPATSAWDCENYPQGLRTLFLAGGLYPRRMAPMEALRQPRVPGEEETMKCPICGREAVADLCSYHLAAKEKVEAAYSLWMKAYGGMEWKEFLDNVKRNAQTGQWSKEVAEFLLGG